MSVLMFKVEILKFLLSDLTHKHSDHFKGWNFSIFVLWLQEQLKDPLTQIVKKFN